MNMFLNDWELCIVLMGYTSVPSCICISIVMSLRELVTFWTGERCGAMVFWGDLTSLFCGPGKIHSNDRNTFCRFQLRCPYRKSKQFSRDYNMGQLPYGGSYQAKSWLFSIAPRLWQNLRISNMKTTVHFLTRESASSPLPWSAQITFQPFAFLHFAAGNVIDR